MHDSKQRYGRVSRILHWGIAILVVWQFLKFFDRIQDGEHWVGQTLVPWHVSIGVLILSLTVLRILWALTQRGRRPEQTGALALAARVGHIVLYACTVLLPVTGMLYLRGNGYGVKVFGMELVAGTGVETDWMIALGSLHSPIAWLFVALVIGHVGAALYHHFIVRDDVFRRMVGTVAD